MVTSTVPRGVHGHEHCTQRCTWSRALYPEVYMVMSTVPRGVHGHEHCTLNFQTHGRIAAEKVQMEQTLHEIQEKVHIVRCVCTRSIATPHHAVPHPIMHCHTPSCIATPHHALPHPIMHCHTPPVPHPIMQCHTPSCSATPIMQCHTPSCSATPHHAVPHSSPHPQLVYM